MDNLKTTPDNQTPFNPETDFRKITELNLKILKYVGIGKKPSSKEIKDIKKEITRLTKARNIFMKKIKRLKHII
jgi:hypothetical protein